jgi:hypothetical protein
MMLAQNKLIQSLNEKTGPINKNRCSKQFFLLWHQRFRILVNSMIPGAKNSFTWNAKQIMTWINIGYWICDKQNNEHGQP